MPRAPQARFDEARNVGFANKLEHAGCNVAYGLVGLKTHCKAMLVVRQEKDGLRTYVHLGKRPPSLTPCALARLLRSRALAQPSVPALSPVGSLRPARSRAPPRPQAPATTTLGRRVCTRTWGC